MFRTKPPSQRPKRAGNDIWIELYKQYQIVIKQTSQVYTYYSVSSLFQVHRHLFDVSYFGAIGTCNLSRLEIVVILRSNRAGLSSRSFCHRYGNSPGVFPMFEPICLFFSQIAMLLCSQYRKTCKWNCRVLSNPLSLMVNLNVFLFVTIDMAYQNPLMYIIPLSAPRFSKKTYCHFGRVQIECFYSENWVPLSTIALQKDK